MDESTGAYYYYVAFIIFLFNPDPRLGEASDMNAFAIYLSELINTLTVISVLGFWISYKLNTFIGQQVMSTTSWHISLKRSVKMQSISKLVSELAIDFL